MATVDDVRAFLRGRFHTALDEALPDRVVEEALSHPRAHKEQPLSWLVRPRVGPERSGSARYRARVNLDQALGSLASARVDPAWVRSRLIRAAGPEFGNAAAAIAELRAAGTLQALSLAGVRPVPASTEPQPDLQVSLAGVDVVVEVICKNMSEAEATRLKAFHEESTELARASSEPIVVRSTSYSLVGPQGDDPVGAEVASKFANIKAGAKQAASGVAAILWIDLQDEDSWGLQPEAAAPVVADRDGRLTSVGLWHAFYGRKNTPLFEYTSPHPKLMRRVYRMRHDGMLHQDHGRRWSAVCLHFPAGCVLFENPDPEQPLPTVALRCLFGLRDFNLPLSRVRYLPDGSDLTDRLRRDADDLVALASPTDGGNGPIGVQQRGTGVESHG